MNGSVRRRLRCRPGAGRLTRIGEKFRSDLQVGQVAEAYTKQSDGNVHLSDVYRRVRGDYAGS